MVASASANTPDAAAKIRIIITFLWKIMSASRTMPQTRDAALSAITIHAETV